MNRHDLRVRTRQHSGNRLGPLMRGDRAEADRRHAPGIIRIGNGTDSAPIAPIDDPDGITRAARKVSRERVAESASRRVISLSGAAFKGLRRRKEEHEIGLVPRERVLHVDRSLHLGCGYCAEIGFVHVAQRAVIQHQGGVNDAIDVVVMLAGLAHGGCGV